MSAGCLYAQADDVHAVSFTSERHTGLLVPPPRGVILCSLLSFHPKQLAGMLWE